MNRRAHEYKRVSGGKGQKKTKISFQYGSFTKFFNQIFFLFFVNHTYSVFDAENTLVEMKEKKKKKEKETYKELFLKIYRILFFFFSFLTPLNICF